jgi:hypothetical protein
MKSILLYQKQEKFATSQAALSKNDFIRDVNRSHSNENANVPVFEFTLVLTFASFGRTPRANSLHLAK